MGQAFKTAALATLLVLTGCGRSAPTNPSPIPLKNDYQAPMPLLPTGGPLPAVAPLQGSPTDQGAQLLKSFRETFGRVPGFDAEIKSYSQGHYKMGERVDELRKSTTQIKLLWMKPNKTRVEVVSTSNPLLEGAAMVTTDGKAVTARAKGLLGLIPFHLKDTDPKLSNNRNHGFTDNNPKSQFERLTGPTAVWTVLADAVIEGAAVKMIRVDGVRRLDKEITGEVVAVDPTTFGVRRITMYAGQTRVIDHTMLKFSWQPRTNSNTFVL